MDELVFRSATEVAQLIRTKQCSSEEVVHAHLQRIESVNRQLNAVVQLDAESSLAHARAADVALARGENKGALHGVPFTAKDVFETVGLIAAAGLKERATFVPVQDAVVVTRMRAAGAILLGKTNCPPGGGGGDTDNPVYGRTNNPYDMTRTVGGSSGGEAAILAAGGSPLGLGSDSGGSIRLPAHFCGVAGLKPTAGRIPNTGTLNHPGGLTDIRTQIGPMARFVDDLGLAFPIIAGADWRDAGVIPMPIADWHAVMLPGLRVAFYTDDGQATPTAETVETVKRTAQHLADAGLSVQEVCPTGIEASREITERYWRMSELSGAEVERLLVDWDGFRSTMLSFVRNYDVILSPADYQIAPPHGTESPLRFNYTLPYSLTGYPCVVVRAGTSPDGLPIGVQVVARPWCEDVALAVAKHIESTMGGWRRPPL